MAATLLTGTAGMIGSSVAEVLLESDHSVPAVDTLTPDKGPKLKKWRLAQLRNREGFTHHDVNVRDGDALSNLCSQKEPNAIANLAALAGVRASLDDPEAYHETNSTGTLNLLELCRKHDVSTFVLASSSSL